MLQQWLGIAKTALLFAILGVEAVSSRTPCVTLASDNQIHQVLTKIVYLSIRLVSNMRVYLGWRSIAEVAAIGQKSQVGGTNCGINVCEESLTCLLGGRWRKSLLNIQCIRKPSKTVDMWATTVLPLKPKPVVLHLQNINVE